MTSTFPFLTPNNLAEFQMNGGSNQELIFNVYDSGSTLINLGGATVTWYLSYFGQETAILTKTAVTAGMPTGQFRVDLVPADTSALHGKFIHQYKIVDSSGSTFRPSQGLILITAGL
jgi:hypothetical protein